VKKENILPFPVIKGLYLCGLIIPNPIMKLAKNLKSISQYLCRITGKSW
jgi:hypothetical protein